MSFHRLRTVAQLREFVEGTQAVQFVVAAECCDRYAHITQVIERFDYRQLPRSDRSVVLRYLELTSGYASAHLKRLVARVLAGQSLERRYVVPAHAYAKRFNQDDIAALVQVDQAFGTLSGAATTRVLYRQWHEYADPRFERLSTISASHLYNLRASQRYMSERICRTHTTTNPKGSQIGQRRAPEPCGQAGFIRIDSVHQGDFDGVKGVYHINAVDIVTQWEVVASVEYIGHIQMHHVMALMVEQFPFTIQAVHSDNGAEYINWRMLQLLEQARIELTKSRPRRSTDNALVESKNGSVVRRMFGYGHIPRTKAGELNQFNREHFNVFNNLHRPCLFATEQPDAKKPGRTKKRYAAKDARTPLEALMSLSVQNQNLKPGVTIEALLEQARRQTDLEAAQALNAAWEELRPQLYKARA